MSSRLQRAHDVAGDEAEKRIEIVLRRWVAPGRESYVDGAVSRLSLLSLLAPLAKRGARHPTSRKAGKQVTEGELQNLDRRLEATLGALNALHEPAIEALAATGMVCQSARLALDRMLSSVRAADLSRVPSDPRRQPSDLFEQAVMGNLSLEYSRLTGARLARSKRFTEFVRKMLAVMHIEIGSVENAVRRECTRRGKNGVLLHPPKRQEKRLKPIS